MADHLEEVAAQCEQAPPYGELPGLQGELPPFLGEGQGSQVEEQGACNEGSVSDQWTEDDILQRLHALRGVMYRGKSKMQNTNSSNATMSVDYPCEDIVSSGGVGRGRNMSKGNRIRIVIPPGKTRPVDPKVASMYATACSIAVKQTVPIFPHWKEYKGREDIFFAYAGHMSISFVTQFSSSFRCCLYN